jgi:hypothetical protein
MLPGQHAWNPAFVKQQTTLIVCCWLKQSTCVLLLLLLLLLQLLGLQARLAAAAGRAHAAGPGSALLHFWNVHHQSSLLLLLLACRRFWQKLLGGLTVLDLAVLCFIAAMNASWMSGILAANMKKMAAKTVQRGLTQPTVVRSPAMTTTKRKHGSSSSSSSFAYVFMLLIGLTHPVTFKHTQQQQLLAKHIA